MPDKLDKSGGTADNLLICGTNEAIKFDDDFLYIYRKINGAWVAQNVWDLRTSQDGIVAFLSDIHDAVQQIAPAFTAKTYAANDLCTYYGVVYHCKMGYTATASSATPDADTTHWEAKPVSDLFLPLTGGTMSGQLTVDGSILVQNSTGDGTVTALSYALRSGITLLRDANARLVFQKDNVFTLIIPQTDGTVALTAGTGHTGNLAALDAQGNPTDSTIPAANVALKDNIPYTLGTPIVIDTATSETVEGETVNYGSATLANRTANIVQVTAATALDELRITFPAATSGKVRDFGLRVEIGTGSAALTAPALVPIAPTGETIKLENADGTIPELADGTATAKGVALLYFSETAPGVFVVKGEQVEEVA